MIAGLQRGNHAFPDDDLNGLYKTAADGQIAAHAQDRDEGQDAQLPDEPAVVESRRPFAGDRSVVTRERGFGNQKPF